MIIIKNITKQLDKFHVLQSERDRVNHHHLKVETHYKIFIGI